MSYKTYSHKNKFLILERDGFKCAYCGRTSYEDDAKLHLDHIRSRSRGGADTADNLITACGQCNSAKGSKLLPVDVEELILRLVDEKNHHSGIPSDTIIRFECYDRNTNKSEPLRLMRRRQ